MKTIGYNSIKSWGISVACGFVNGMIKLPLTASSMLFVAFVDHYDTDRQNAAYFLTVCIVLRCLAGPLTGFLGEIIDLRHITLVGCLIGSLGTGCCYFAEDTLAVTVFLGIIYGIGFAIAQPLLPQILKQHFNKNIANANGVFNSVSCVLSFAIIPVISGLIKLYDVSGALLIASGIMLHGVPVAMLLKNPDYKNLNPSLPGTIPCKNEKYQLTITESKLQLKDNVIHSEDKETQSFSYKHVESTELKKSIVNKISSPASIYKQKPDCVYDVVNETLKINEPLNEIHQKTQSSINVEMNSLGNDKYDNAFKYVLKEDSICNQSSIEKQSKYRGALETLLVLKDPSFLVITFCQSFLGYVTVFLYLIIIEISRDKGFPQSEEYFFLVFFSVAEIIGHTCLGWVTDKEYLSVSNYISTCFLFKGIACGTFLLSNNYFIIMISFMVFASCFAASSSAYPSLVYEFIEEKQQAMAVASRFLLYTPLIFTMAPIIEYFRGTLGSYDGVLYLLTGICLSCAVLLIILPFIAKCSSRKK